MNLTIAEIFHVCVGLIVVVAVVSRLKEMAKGFSYFIIQSPKDLANWLWLFN